MDRIIRQTHKKTLTNAFLIFLVAVTFLQGQILCVMADGKMERTYVPCCLAEGVQGTRLEVSLLEEDSQKSCCERCVCLPFMVADLNPSIGSLNEVSKDVYVQPMTIVTASPNLGEVAAPSYHDPPPEPASLTIQRCTVLLM